MQGEADSYIMVCELWDREYFHYLIPKTYFDTYFDVTGGTECKPKYEDVHLEPYEFISNVDKPILGFYFYYSNVDY